VKNQLSSPFYTTFPYVSATELVDERLARVQQDSDDRPHGLFLTRLLHDKHLGMEQIYSDVLDLLIAGTDTVRLITAPS